MKPLLLYKNRDYTVDEPLPWNEQFLMQDLELNTLFNAMSQGDSFLFETIKRVVLSGVNNDVETILYRQDILKDCIKNPRIINALFDIACEAIEKEKHNYWNIFSKYPSSIVSRARRVLLMFADMLTRLRSIADEKSSDFISEGFENFFCMLQTQLTDYYLESIHRHLEELEFDNGMLMTAELGAGNNIVNWVLNQTQINKLSWLKRVVNNYVTRKTIEREGKRNWFLKLFFKKSSAYTFFISTRDEGGIRALSELKDEGLNQVANVLAQSSDHILGFFKILQAELAFYKGCINLHEQLVGLGEPCAFGNPLDAAVRNHAFKGLYDVCLALTKEQEIVGNDLSANEKELFIVTGANQGGKSTFLRSIGLAQLMMQSGMFVPAEEFRANICGAIYTHYKREEDSALKSGKLDEELDRMDKIVGQMSSGALILFNESFAATNERDGSEIASQIVKALVESGVKVFFVTHMYRFANDFYIRRLSNALFLRAERTSGGQRTFRITAGAPLQTSYGRDLYDRIFHDKTGVTEVLKTENHFEYINKY